MAQSDIESLEKMNQLEAEVKMLRSQNIELNKTVESQKDYAKLQQDKFDLEKRVDELDKENEELLMELDTRETDLENAQIKIEDFMGGVEEAYLETDDIQIVSDFKVAYYEIKKKLNIYFEISAEEKIELEEKVEGLNSKLQEMQAERSNVMDSAEVQREINKRDRDIDELMEMLDGYKDSNKLIEKMTAKNEKLEKINVGFQTEVEQAKKRTEEIEEELKEEKQFGVDLEATIKDLEEEVEVYEEMQKENEEREVNYEQIVDDLKEQVSTLQEAASELESTKFHAEAEKDNMAGFLHDMSKQKVQDEAAFKKQVLSRSQARYWFFEAEKNRVLLGALPGKIKALLNIEGLEKYSELEYGDVLLNASAAILFEEYVFNETLATESPNLAVNARDLLVDLMNFKIYLAMAKYYYAKQGEDKENDPEQGKRWFIDIIAYRFLKMIRH